MYAMSSFRDAYSNAIRYAQILGGRAPICDVVRGGISVWRLPFILFAQMLCVALERDYNLPKYEQEKTTYPVFCVSFFSTRRPNSFM